MLAKVDPGRYLVDYISKGRNPADLRRNINVIITSKRRRNVVFA